MLVSSYMKGMKRGELENNKWNKVQLKWHRITRATIHPRWRKLMRAKVAHLEWNKARVKKLGKLAIVERSISDRAINTRNKLLSFKKITMKLYRKSSTDLNRRLNNKEELEIERLFSEQFAQQSKKIRVVHLILQVVLVHLIDRLQMYIKMLSIKKKDDKLMLASRTLSTIFRVEYLMKISKIEDLSDETQI